MWSVDDLIVAAATPRAGAARAVVRLAGPGLAGLLSRLFAKLSEMGGQPERRPRFHSTMVSDPVLTEAFGPLDVGLLYWPGPSGPVGGPLAEVQLPGCVPLVDAFVERACALGARLARGGEFSLRAFLAGRIDLLQAEAVLSVVDAQSPAELSEALDRMAGGTGRELEAVRRMLLDIAADIEATIDFGEEALGAETVRSFVASLASRLAAADDALGSLAARLRSRGGCADTPRVVIVGRPNIGKSSLFNRLAGRAAALVADELGTTRDWVEVRADAGGIELVLVDVAGIDTAAVNPAAAIDPAAAVAAAQIASADVLVACTDAADAGEPDFIPPHPHRIDVVTRGDAVARPTPPAGAILTSSIDGTGIEDLRRRIGREVAAVAGRPSPATARLAEGVVTARRAIAEAVAASGFGGHHGGDSFDEAVVASHVGRAVAALGGVTGVEIGNDLLDRIFSRHCIGK